MSSQLKAELAATCSTLGRFHKGEYLIEPDCIESVKDLIRYLKRDDEMHEIRRYLGESKILQNDLVHIIKSCPEGNSELFDVTLRLLINLTTPTIFFFGNEIPSEKIGRNIYLSLTGYGQSYKMAFCDVEFWSKVCGILTNLLETDWAERSADDGLKIERILLLLRNVLHILADQDSEKIPENDITSHDKVLWALRQSQILELLLFLSGNANEEQYFLNLLEIFSLVLREQSAKVLAQCDIYRSGIEKTKDEEDLVKVREFEKNCRNKYLNVRNFNATFLMKGVKSLSNNDVVCHKFLPKGNMFKPSDLNKRQVKVRKNQIPIESEGPERRSTFSTRLFLKEFCVEFLTGSFKNVMHVAKNKLVSGKSLASDQTYYFWAVKFFLEFAISSNSDVTLIDDVVSLEMFHFVQMSLDDAFEHLSLDKKRAVVWVKRIHLILKAYRSLLETLLWMDSSKSALARSISREIKSQIFFAAEYREMTLHILLRYDPTKFSMSFLRDIIETVHLFIKLLEEHAKQTKLVVQEVVRRKPKAKKRRQVTESGKEKWEKIKDDVYDTLCSEKQFPEISPFDATMKIPIEDQKGTAMKNIQRLLRTGKIIDGIGLLRSARQVWPENEYFGKNEMSVEEETMALQEICISNLSGKKDNYKERINEEEKGKEDIYEDGDDDDDDDDDEDEGCSNHVNVVEKDFDVMDYKKRLVNKKIVEGCGTLLKNYQKNSDHTNHCIIKFLYRIGWECCMPAMLYQASLFWTLLKIFQDKTRKYNEINTFTMNLIRRFRKHATEHPVVFLELLFWKEYNIALEVQHGYEPYVDGKKTIKRNKKNSGKLEEGKKRSRTKQKAVLNLETSEQATNTLMKQNNSNSNSSNEFHIVDILESENESSIADKNGMSRILFKANFDSGNKDKMTEVKDSSSVKNKSSKLNFSFINIEKEKRARKRKMHAVEKTNDGLKKKYKISKYTFPDSDDETGIQSTANQKRRDSKTLSSNLIEARKSREHLPNRIFHEQVTQTHKKAEIQLDGSLAVEDQECSNHGNKSKTPNTSSKKRVWKAKSRRISELSDQCSDEDNYSTSKPSRYISSESEEEELIPVKRRWRKSAITDSGSDMESAKDDIRF